MQSPFAAARTKFLQLHAVRIVTPILFRMVRPLAALRTRKSDVDTIAFRHSFPPWPVLLGLVDPLLGDLCNYTCTNSATTLANRKA